MRRLFGSALGLLLLSCSDDPAPPSIPPLAQLELLAPGATGGAAPCVARGGDPRQTIVGQVALKNFTLRPPLACTVAECGTVQLTLEQGGRTWQFESAERWLSIPTLGMPDGRYQVTATLLDTFGRSYRSRDDKRPTCKNCERTFTLAPYCGDPPVPPEPEPSAPADAGSGPNPSDASAPSSDAGMDAGTPPELPVPVDAASPFDAAAPEPDAIATDAAAPPDAGAPVGPIVDAALTPVDAGPATPSDAAAEPDATRDAN